MRQLSGLQLWTPYAPCTSSTLASKLQPTILRGTRPVIDNHCGESEPEGKEPFFGFLEWISIGALISGGIFPILLKLEGVVRILGIGMYGALIALSGLLLYRYRVSKTR